MENSHPMSEIIASSMESLKQLVDVNTVIGEPITSADGTVIIPISKVTFGFATGGSQFPTDKASIPFGGGAGGGATVTPVAFLVIPVGGEVKLLQFQTADNTADRIVNMMPDVIDKVNGFINKNKPKEETTETV